MTQMDIFKLYIRYLLIRSGIRRAPPILTWDGMGTICSGEYCLDSECIRNKEFKPYRMEA